MIFSCLASKMINARNKARVLLSTVYLNFEADRQFLRKR